MDENEQKCGNCMRWKSFRDEYGDPGEDPDHGICFDKDDPDINIKYVWPKFMPFLGCCERWEDVDAE